MGAIIATSQQFESASFYANGFPRFFVPGIASGK